MCVEHIVIRMLSDYTIYRCGLAHNVIEYQSQWTGQARITSRPTLWDLFTMWNPDDKSLFDARYKFKSNIKWHYSDNVSGYRGHILMQGVNEAIMHSAKRFILEQTLFKKVLYVSWSAVIEICINKHVPGVKIYIWNINLSNGLYWIYCINLRLNPLPKMWPH